MRLSLAALAAIFVGTLAALPMQPADATVLMHQVKVGTYVCADLTNGNTAPGTPVQVWPCYSGVNQQWTLEGMEVIGPYSTGTTQHCLDNVNGLVVLNKCTGASSQEWYFSNGQFIREGNADRKKPREQGARSRHGISEGGCLDARTSQTGIQLVTNPCNGGPSQMWSLE
jgi:hypothetical protein